MTRKISVCCLAALLCSVASASLGLAQQANPDAAKKEAAQRKAKLSHGGTWVGKIADMEKDDVSFTFETEIVVTYWEVVPIRDAYGRIIGVRRTVRVHREPVRVEVWLPADVTVRLPVKPDLDEQGRPLRTNPKGQPNDPDRKLVGVPGALKDLRRNQLVRVTLERNRQGHLFAKTIVVLNERVRRS